jgi:hypothetical protein
MFDILEWWQGMLGSFGELDLEIGNQVPIIMQALSGVYVHTMGIL